MVRILVIVVALLVAVEVFALVDAAFAKSSRVRALPKPVWIIVILVIPVLGWLLWFLVGRPRRESGGSEGASGPGRSRGGSRRPPRPVAPDDDPDFLRRLGRDLDSSGPSSPPEPDNG